MKLPWVLAGALAASVVVGSAAAASNNAKPNILYIMADDLNADWKNDRLAWMPNLNKYFAQGGTEFKNHVAAQPVCGPSRSSMLLGRYPHNTGYKANSDDTSTNNYLRQHNSTVGKWLKDAGYYTAFFGKYVNGCEGHVPSGWSWWGGLVNTYDFYNATIWEKNWEDPDFGPPQQKTLTHIHQADFLGNFTVEHAEIAVKADRPFFISVTPVMPHWGTCYGPGPNAVYAQDDPHWEFQLFDPLDKKIEAMPISPCPTNRNRHRFDAQTNPRIPGVWNVSITGNRPLFMKTAFEDPPGHLTAWQAYREDIGWQNRSASLIDLDEMIGAIITGLDDLNVLENTIIFFTSDNGYHLGEHKMPFGKGQPYDTDVRLPMYVRGPGVLKGRILPHPTNHLDITATIVELAMANAHAPTNLDGLSFASELSHQGDPAVLGDRWRQHSFSEFFSNDDTWQLVRVVNSTTKYSYMWWCSNDTEVFNMKEDEWQSANLDGTGDFAARANADAGRIINALGLCSGDSCHNPVPAAASPKPGATQCYAPFVPGANNLGSMRVVFDPKTAKATGLRGWAVNLLSALPGKRNGTSPVTVHLRVDGSFGVLAPFVANVQRNDLPKAYPQIPDPFHGFPDVPLPPSVMAGRKKIVLFGSVPTIKAREPYGKDGKALGQAVCICDGKACPAADPC